MALLSASFLERLERLQLEAGARLAGQLAGDHRSTRYGHALDFADFREYVPGDDFRRIDYHVLARLDTLLIKLFEADDDLVVRILLDTSASMSIHGKLTTAKQLAAALGVVALTSNDAVLVHAFPSPDPPRRFVSRTSVAPLLHHIEHMPSGGETPFVKAVGALLARPGPPGMTIVISDLLTAEWRQAVGRLRSRGAGLVVAHVIAAADLEPPEVGDFDLIDVESGQYTPVSLSPDVLDEHRSEVRRWLADVKSRTHQVGGAYIQVPADADVEDTILTGWRARGVVR